MEEGDRRVVSVLTEVGALRRPLDYAVPEDFAGPIDAGSRVRVPLHGRSVRGWIIGPGTGDHPPGGLLPIKSSLGIGPPAALVELCAWAAWRWAGTEARFLAGASPERVVSKLPRPRGNAIEAPAPSQLAAEGAALAKEPAAVLRLGPATDPIDLVVGFAAEAAAAREGSVLVLVPSLGWAGRLVKRLSARGIDAVNLADAWDAARAGWGLVVGTRSAAFAPVPALAGALVLDAEDERYRSEGAPTWSAVDVVLERGRRDGAPVAVVSATPSPSLAILPGQRRLPAAAESSGWPGVEVADRRDVDPRSGWFSEELVALGTRALERSAPEVAIACIINRTGRARLLACGRCRELARCASCAAAASLDGEDLVCPRCAERRPVVCTACGGTTMKLLRPGTAQLAPQLGALFGQEVAEITGSTAPTALVGARVVVGTEAVLHRVRRAGLVCFLDLDDHLLAPRPGAELAALSIIGRAGRLVGERSSVDAGTVLLQTKLPQHPVVLAAISGDPSPVVDADVALRRALGLPPFVEVARLRGAGADELAERCARLGLDRRPLGDGELALVAPSASLLCDALSEAGRPKERVSVSVGAEIA